MFPTRKLVAQYQYFPKFRNRAIRTFSAVNKEGNFTKKFESFSQKPNQYAAASLIKETYLHANVEDAFKVYRTLVSANVRPDNFVFSALLTTCRKHQENVRAIGLLREMKTFNVRVFLNLMNISGTS